MNRISVLTIALYCCLACSGPKQETTEANDTTLTEPDTVILENRSQENSTSPAEVMSPSDAGILKEMKGELYYILPGQYSFISEPYDFPLDTASIQKLLGAGVETQVQEFEGGEDYGPFSYFTVTYQDTKISFYNYPGKHFCTITTPRLPLKNGIKIGMRKADFLQAILLSDSSAQKATVYRLADDYGSMDFSFRGDTLYLIYAYYEEGD